jgi:hypothetical protein
MRDKQNPRLDKDESSPASTDGSAREKSRETPRSYYYDDATGYEIYQDESEAETDEQGDSAEDES